MFTDNEQCIVYVLNGTSYTGSACFTVPYATLPSIAMDWLWGVDTVE